MSLTKLIELPLPPLPSAGLFAWIVAATKTVTASVTANPTRFALAAIDSRGIDFIPSSAKWPAKRITPKAVDSRGGVISEEGSEEGIIELLRGIKAGGLWSRPRKARLSLYHMVSHSLIEPNHKVAVTKAAVTLRVPTALPRMSS
jgi:hypothetical protein